MSQPCRAACALLLPPLWAARGPPRAKLALGSARWPPEGMLCVARQTTDFTSPCLGPDSPVSIHLRRRKQVRFVMVSGLADASSWGVASLFITQALQSCTVPLETAQPAPATDEPSPTPTPGNLCLCATHPSEAFSPVRPPPQQQCLQLSKFTSSNPQGTVCKIGGQTKSGLGF